MSNKLRLRIGGLYVARVNYLSSYTSDGRLVEIDPGKPAVYLGSEQPPSSALVGRPPSFVHNFLFEDKLVRWCCPPNDDYINDWWKEA